MSASRCTVLRPVRSATVAKTRGGPCGPPPIPLRVLSRLLLAVGRGGGRLAGAVGVVEGALELQLAAGAALEADVRRALRRAADLGEELRQGGELARQRRLQVGRDRHGELLAVGARGVAERARQRGVDAELL